jgi:site-specific DNA recombinase
MLTAQEFADVQALLRRNGTTRPQRYTFAFAGLLSCGSCGRAVSAEQKVNRHGSRYVYYHCAARSRISSACAERSVEEAELSKQCAAFLASINLRPETVSWVRDQLRSEQAQAATTADKIAASQMAAHTEIAAQLKELTSLRLRRMVDDDEFVRERKLLEAARQTIENAPDPASGKKVFELLDLVERISVQAMKWFEIAPPSKKQKILKTVCSNPVLTNKMLSVEAAKPFIIRSDLDDDVHLRRRRDSNPRSR